MAALVEPMACVVGVIVCLSVIAIHRWAPWADQHALLTCGVFAQRYPEWTAGLSSCWISAAVSVLTGDDPLLWNQVMRSVTAALYLLSSALLARAVLGNVGLRVLVQLLIIASLYPFVWISSELVVGAFLNVSLWAILTRRAAPLRGGVLGALAFAKPDLLVVAVALLSFDVATESLARSRRRVLGSFVATVALLLLPGVVSRGAAYLTEHSRAWQSFAQHANILFYGQWIWTDWEMRIQRYFPGATSVGDAMRRHPARYLEYVRLSLEYGRHAFSAAFGALLWFMPVALGWMVRRRAAAMPLARLLAVALIGTISWVLLAFPHVRYMARYVPAIVVLLCHAADAALQQRPPKWFSVATLGVFAVSCALYLVKGFAAIDASLGLPASVPFWGAD